MTVKSHIDVLKTLYVVNEVQPHPQSTGKPRLYLCDAGVCGWLGGTFERQLETAFYVEQFAKLSYLGLEGKVQFSSFRSLRGSFVHGVWESAGKIAFLKILPTERIDKRELMILQSLKERFSSLHPKAYCLAGTRHPETIDGVRALPWEAMA